MILAWISEEYIGTGGVQLEFTTEDTPGFIQTSDTHTDTVATLISSNQRSLTIMSTLQIVVSSNVSMSHPSSVTCEHRTNGTNRTLTFQHLGMSHIFNFVTITDRVQIWFTCTHSHGNTGVY